MARQNLLEKKTCVAIGMCSLKGLFPIKALLFLSQANKGVAGDAGDYIIVGSKSSTCNSTPLKRADRITIIEWRA